MTFIRSVACFAMIAIICSSCATATKPGPERRITGVSSSKDTASVSAKTTPGNRYQLQKASSLVNPVWKNVGGPITADGQSIAITDTNATDLTAFYRIIPVN